MHKISKIVRIEQREKFGRPYFRTYAVLDNGDEVVGFSDERTHFQVGDSVESFFDDRWNTAKMQKPESPFKPGDNSTIDVT